MGVLCNFPGLAGVAVACAGCSLYLQEYAKIHQLCLIIHYIIIILVRVTQPELAAALAGLDSPGPGLSVASGGASYGLGAVELWVQKSGSNFDRIS